MSNTKTHDSKMVRQMGVIPANGFMRAAQVLSVLPIGRTALYEGVKKGIYPEQIKLSKRTSAWIASEIAELCELLAQGKNWHDRSNDENK